MNIVTKKRKLSKCFAAIAVSAAAAAAVTAAAFAEGGGIYDDGSGTGSGGGIYVADSETHSVGDFTVTGGSKNSFGIGGDFDKAQRQPLTIVGESSVNDKLDANNTLNMV